MPELPEVETIRRQLAPHLEGRTIVDAEILDPRWTRPEPPELVQTERCAGRRVERVGALAASTCVWELSRGPAPADPPADDRGAAVRPAPPSRPTPGCASSSTPVTASCTSIPAGSAPATCCPGGPRATPTWTQRIGIEPMTPEFTVEHLRAMARGRTAPVKSFVLDQRRIAGVGNIYADEALFRARIHPLRPAGALTGASSPRCARRSRRR